MRIRGKRQDPLFLSSDLYFNQVQPQVHSVGSSQPSDRASEGGINRRDLSDHINNDVLTKEEIKRNKEDHNNIRKKNIDLGLLDSKQTASSQEDDLKMKKTSKKGLEQKGSSSTSSNNLHERKKEEEEAQETFGLMDNNVGTVVTASGKGKKKARGGGVLMEGSRCSRVNGRGWRCCQPTLVGYSLCEHHLGKGRVRSTTSEKGQKSNFDKIKKKQKKKNKKSFDYDDDDVDDADYDDEEEDDDVGMKKRMKLGTVKARSISSLLGETRNDVVVALSDDDYDDDDDDK